MGLAGRLVIPFETRLARSVAAQDDDRRTGDIGVRRSAFEALLATLWSVPRAIRRASRPHVFLGFKVVYERNRRLVGSDDREVMTR